MFGNRPKYGNSKCEWNGIKFDSKRELQRYQFLLALQDKGVISDLQLQVVFEIIPTQYEDSVKALKTKNKIVRKVLHRPITYKCDFAYIINTTRQYVVEDVKISKYLIPKEFLLKEKLLYYFKRIRIHKVFKPTEPIYSD